MNPIDILGEILNAGAGKRGGNSRGGGADILKDILGGGGPQRGGSSSGGIEFPGVFGDRSSSSGSGSPTRGPSAQDLEDMLGVGRSPQGGSPSRSAPVPPPTPVPTPGPSNRSSFPKANAPQGDIFGQQPVPSQRELSPAESEQLIVLIRAMIYAGKADGRIDAQEQQAILDKVGNTNPETVRFLREEFANATNARDFAWSVPLGMESAVYAASLACISLDQSSEIDYLKELAHGLRLSPKVCNQLHQQYGLRTIY